MRASFFHRESCRLCDSSKVELVVKLEPIPLSENYSETSEGGKKAERYPVDLYMCADCGHVQQLDVVDSKSLWEEYTYYSADAKGMPQHFCEVADNLLQTYQPTSDALIIDIGSNDGSLLRPFKETGRRVLGIDPATTIARLATEAGIETIPELMTEPLADRIVSRYGKAQIICMFNAFAHADNLSEIAQSICKMLAPNGIFVFEAQYLLDIIDRVLIGSIFHEHMSHHSIKSVSQFLERNGLDLIHVERNPIQHGSIIGTVQLTGAGREVHTSVSALLKLEESRQLDQIATLKNFANKLTNLRRRTSKLVQGWRDAGMSIAAYGAARSGPTLIAQLGLSGAIDYIVDDHPQKIGKYSSGDGIPIIATEELYRRMPRYTIILAWVHAAKIIEANSLYLQNGGHFVVLCPETRVIGINGDIPI